MTDVAEYDTKQSPASLYEVLERGYDILNSGLFGGGLPLCLLTLNRKKGAAGYFSPERFTHRHEKGGEKGPPKTDEIALNPDDFRGMADIDIWAILAHEMAHCWQQHKGKPGRGGLSQ